MNPIPIENQIKGWLMVAAVIVLTLFAAWPAHAHDTLLQGGPRFAYAGAFEFPWIWLGVLFGFILLLLGALLVIASYYPDGNDMGPDEPSQREMERRHAEEARRHWDQWG